MTFILYKTNSQFFTSTRISINVPKISKNKIPEYFVSNFWKFMLKINNLHCYDIHSVQNDFPAFFFNTNFHQ